MSQFQIIAVHNGRSIEASETIFTGSKREAKFAARVLGDKTRSGLKDQSAKTFLYALAGFSIASKVGEF